MSASIPSPSSALRIIEGQLEAAREAKKCRPCGCFQSTLGALAASTLGGELQPAIARAREAIAPKEYDCLGCPICYPAIAANAFAEALPEQADSLGVCPTDMPIERRGWPPLPGDYQVVRHRAPIAVCTLNSDGLVKRLLDRDLPGLALVGTLRTENLGIERLIRNVLANPHIRFLVLCGEDTRESVGHLPGQALASLFESGVDEHGRIRGAQGKRPVLKNVSAAQIRSFLRKVELLNRIGADDEHMLADCIETCRERDPGPSESDAGEVDAATVQAHEPRHLVPDRAGFFVVYPDALRRVLVVEHYTEDGVLDTILEGRTPAAVCSTAIERKLVTRLDHAAYLGRELALAERSMKTGERYVQDRAPGDLWGAEIAGEGCGCSAANVCGNAK